MLAVIVFSIPFYIDAFIHQRALFFRHLPFLPAFLFLYLRMDTMNKDFLYRAFCFLVSLLLMLQLIFQDSSMIYAVFNLLLPPTYILLLGRKEGSIWSLLFLAAAAFLRFLTLPMLSGAAESAGYPDTAEFFTSPAYSLTVIVSYITITIISYLIDSLLTSLIDSLSATNKQLRERNKELKKTKSELNLFKNTLPVCSSCKRIRDENGTYVDVDIYIRDHSDSQVSHGLCPDCLRRLYPDAAQEVLGNIKEVQVQGKQVQQEADRSEQRR